MRQPPRLRLRLPPGDVLRDLAPGKVPHANVLLIPLGGVHTSADGVESVAVRAGVVGGRIEPTANVLLADVAVVVALVAREETLLRFVLEAAVVGVRGDDVVVRRVGAFNYIQFATLGPV